MMNNNMLIVFDLREGAGRTRENLMKPEAVGLPAPDCKNKKENCLIIYSDLISEK